MVYSFRAITHGFGIQSAHQLGYNYMRAREFKLPEYVVFFNRQFKHRSSHAFGNEIEVYLTHLGNGFWILSHGFGMLNALLLLNDYMRASAHKLSMFLKCRTIIYIPFA